MRAILKNISEFCSAETPDHLGNVRVAFGTGPDGAPAILQESHYYPYGMRQADNGLENSDNKFLYNGSRKKHSHPVNNSGSNPPDLKGINAERSGVPRAKRGGNFGLNWYHYGARYYNPQLGRWQSFDLVDESLSGYQFVSSNPINFHDPDGNQKQRGINITIQPFWPLYNPIAIKKIESYTYTDKYIIKFNSLSQIEEFKKRFNEIADIKYRVKQYTALSASIYGGWKLAGTTALKILGQAGTRVAGSAFTFFSGLASIEAIKQNHFDETLIIGSRLELTTKATYFKENGRIIKEVITSTLTLRQPGKNDKILAESRFTLNFNNQSDLSCSGSDLFRQIL